jgi:hypothetical protein
MKRVGQRQPTGYVLIDFRDEEMREIVGVVGPFATEEEADQWDESTGQRMGEHLILPLWAP